MSTSEQHWGGRASATLRPEERTVRFCLICLALSLLLVGAVSGTVLRHVIQIVPIILVLFVLAQRSESGAYAAMPVFVFWAFIVVLIWSFLLGVSRAASGHYTPLEVAMTFVMFGCSIVGVTRSQALGRPLAMPRRLSTIVVFAVIQVAAMWLSLLGPVANR